MKLLTTKRLYFLPSKHGDIAVCETGDLNTAKACLIVIPPLLEELNASRRLLSHLALALAKKNWLTLQFDLFGTGDSSGDLEHAQISIWQQNLEEVIQHCITHNLTYHLLTVRSGALILSGFAHCAASHIGWHPVFDGEEWYRPLSRMALFQPKSPSASPIFGGYSLTSELLNELRETKLKWQDQQAQATYYVESLSPPNTPSAKLLDTPPFWIHNEQPLDTFSGWIDESLAWLEARSGA